MICLYRPTRPQTVTCPAAMFSLRLGIYFLLITTHIRIPENIRHTATYTAKYKLCKRQTQRAIKSAKWSFEKNKLYESLEQNNSKPLWRYIKSKRQDGNDVSPLKENSQLHSDSRRKADILNEQFCLVFTSEDTINIPKLPGPPNAKSLKLLFKV